MGKPLAPIVISASYPRPELRSKAKVISPSAIAVTVRKVLLHSLFPSRGEVFLILAGEVLRDPNAVPPRQPNRVRLEHAEAPRLRQREKPFLPVRASRAS